MRKVINIVGLDCPACAAKLEELLYSIDGVSNATVLLIHGKVKVTYDGEDVYEKIISTINNFEDVQVLKKGEESKNTLLWAWIRILVSTILIVSSFLLKVWGMSAFTKVFTYILYATSYLVIAYPVLLSTVKNLAKGKVFDENFLMSIASIGALCLQEFVEGVLVMILYQTGEALQAAAVGSSRKSVTRLVELKAETATRLIQGGAETVSPEELSVGDILLIKAGDKVPCDSILLSKSATIDTKSLTGESALTIKQSGEEILAGVINEGDAFMAKVVRDYENSAVAKILDMVENSMERKAAPEKFITKFSKVYTPIVCMLAVCIAIFPPIVLGIVDGSFAFVDGRQWVKSALTFLVISCPCALVISVPLTYFSGIGSCAKRGILVKSAASMDTVARVKVAALDKTGTLTKGNFSVIGCFPEGISEEEMLFVCAALERYSAHPISGAFADIESSVVASDVQELAGKGLKGSYNGKKAIFGTATLLREEGYSVLERFSADTVLYLIYDGVYAGCVEIGDKIREESKELIADLHELSIHSVMLTGDSPARAQKVANTIGMSAFKAGLLPNQKVEKMQELRLRGKVLYAGDGINDAPVMAAADCSIAMGALGSAAAVEAADFVLVSDSVEGIPTLIRTARKTRNIVLQNILFSIVAKVVFMALGLFPWFPLWLAVFADVGVMLLAVLNSLRVRKI